MKKIGNYMNKIESPVNSHAPLNLSMPPLVGSSKKRSSPKEEENKTKKTRTVDTETAYLRDLRDKKALIDHIVNTIALQENVWHNSPLDVFTGQAIPVTPLSDYIYTVAYYTNTPKEVLVLATQYLCETKSGEPESLVLSAYNIHRLFLTAMRLATKFHQDTLCSQKEHADVGGVPLQELNEMELLLFNHKSMNFFISHVDYDRFYKKLTQQGPEP